MCGPGVAWNRREMNQLQDLLTEALIRTKHVEHAAVINIQEKKVCASTSGFHVPPENALNLIYSFYKNLLEVRREGLYFKEKYYKCVRADENSIYLHNADGGLIVVKTKTLILVATYRVGMYPSVCVEAVEKLADYFRQKGTGVDVILDCVGSSYWEKNLKCLSTGGRWIIYGLLSGGEVHGDLLGKLLSKRGSIQTSLLRPRDKEYKEQLVKAFTEDVLPYFSGGASPHLQPVVDSIYPLHQIAQAHKFMEENKNIGKIVIEMPTSS